MGYMTGIVEFICYYFTFFWVSKHRVNVYKFVIFSIVALVGRNFFSSLFMLPEILFLCFSSYSVQKRWNTLSVFYVLYTYLSTDVLLKVLGFIAKKSLSGVPLFLAEILALPVIVLLLQFLLLKSCQSSLDTLRKDEQLQQNSRLKFLNLALFLCLMGHVFVFSSGNYQGNSQEMLEVAVLLLLLLFLLSLHYAVRHFSQHQLLERKDQELEQLLLYTNQIEGLYSELRGFRHDYQNLLVSLENGIHENDMFQVQMIYEAIHQHADKRLNESKFEIGKLINLKNPALKSVFSNKLTIAIQKKIQVNLEIVQPITDFRIDLVDLVRILTILLDNAIESSVCSKNPTLSIAIFEDKTFDQQQLIIENSCAEKQVIIQNIFRVGYSTKGENRGFGLSNVGVILSEYSNVFLTTESADYTFRQTLYIRNGE
ncbi:MAG: GHKL domain-containing protein [Lactobacillales bacterium]|nr:GHKL domain-containing protein [Lactobacillales bacterium]